MTNIEPMRWKCTCGSKTFHLYMDGTVKCCGCHGTATLAEVMQACGGKP